MTLLGYIAKRIAYMLVVLFLLACLNFFLFEYVPQAILGLGVRFFVPFASAQQALHGGTAIDAAVIKQFGLNQPWPFRFEKYIVNVFTGQFGNGISAISDRRPVWSILAQYAPNTLILLGTSTVISIILGALMGVISSSKRGKFVDLSSLSVSIFAFSVPSFWIGLILLYFFSIQNHWFPRSLGEATGSGLGGAPIPVGSLHYFQAYLWAATLPIIVLTFISFGGYMLIMRNTMNDILTEDYIMMARAKGLSERAVLYKHAFRNALLPLITTVAIAFGFILSGAIITETIFSFTGLGWASIIFITANDYPVMQGLFFLIAVMVVLANFIADVAYGFLDPRVSY
jgi:peptide/nickel transport system permease protein